MRTAYKVPGRQPVNVVSMETRGRFDNPVTMLAVRVAGSRAYTGACFLFSLNPKSFTYTQSARTGVQDTTGGWVINESGMGAPHYKLQGNFGWKLRKIPLKDYAALAKGAAGYLPSLNQTLRSGGKLVDDYAQLQPKARAGSAGAFELDGQQAWQALRDFVTWYSENNVSRVRKGEAPLEMVFFDTLHALRWVVSPVAAPTLEHAVDHQGVTPYMLELIGCYDDTRPREVTGLPKVFATPSGTAPTTITTQTPTPTFGVTPGSVTIPTRRFGLWDGKTGAPQSSVPQPSSRTGKQWSMK